MSSGMMISFYARVAELLADGEQRSRMGAGGDKHGSRIGLGMCLHCAGKRKFWRSYIDNLPLLMASGKRIKDKIRSA